MYEIALVDRYVLRARGARVESALGIHERVERPRSGLLCALSNWTEGGSLVRRLANVSSIGRILDPGVVGVAMSEL